MASRFSHPLAGSDLSTIFRVLNRSGGIPAAHIPRVLGVAGAVAGRLPFTLGEKVYVAAKLKNRPKPRSPVFILGHWRSGTTHLYNTMVRDGFAYVPPLAAGMPWDMFGVCRLFRPLLEKALPEHRFVDAIPVNPDSPQEDEVPLANMMDISYYHAIYFPERLERYFDSGVFMDGLTDTDIARWERVFLYLMYKLELKFGGKRLLIKNPVYTARIVQLRRLFPDAKFIHIHRDPYAVFRSMRNFYKKLFAEFAFQSWDHVDIDALIVKTYGRIMDAVIKDTTDLSPEQFIEIGYETLDNNPLGAIGQIYRALDLGDFEAAAPRFQGYLDTIGDYRKNRFPDDPGVIEAVNANWGRFLDHWGYPCQGAA